MSVDFLLLPQPDSPELSELIASEHHRVLYGYLYMRHDDPPTMVEIRAHALAAAGSSHSQTDRRVRELREHFDIAAIHTSHGHVYLLRGPQAEPRTQRTAISGRVRAQVLIHQRCAQCGKTPTGDGVKLQVDHKLPLTWGGTNDVENLQALCLDCNHDKRDFFATFDGHADKIRRAATYQEPHKRIGETLKAFQAAGEYAPSEVVGLVASMIQYQEDWQKRMRELRELDWDYKTHKRKEYGRICSYYELTRWTPWPPGPVAAVIKQIEKSKKLTNAVRQ